jgi:putative Mn2+ efflux pump MntP
LLVALSLGLPNFATTIGIRISGTDARTRWRVGVVFGLFEAGMPVVGLLVGRGLASLRSYGAALGWHPHVLGRRLTVWSS